jgi:hypothetical protein
MLQCYVLTCGRSVTAFLAPPRSQRPGQGPRSPHPKAGPGLDIWFNNFIIVAIILIILLLTYACLHVISFLRSSHRTLYSPVLPPFVLLVLPTSKYSNGAWWKVNIVHILIMPFPPLLSEYYLFSLTPKHLPQHPILRHPQPTFLSQCDRPSFTSIQNNRQKYCFVYLNVCLWRPHDVETVIHIP